MSDVLNKTTVLVLNRNWQAIGVKTPAEAFSMMATGNATALKISGDDDMTPVTFEDWMCLAVDPGDNCIGTVKGPVRVPTVLVLARFDRVPKRRRNSVPNPSGSATAASANTQVASSSRTKATSTTSSPSHAEEKAPGTTACLPTKR